MGPDLRAREHRPAVEADAGAPRRPVHAQAARVGAEAVGRVLGGDAALQRGATDLDEVLGQAQVGEGLSRRDAHLRRDQVDVGDLLGDRVLDLDAGVHLDEDVAAVLAEQELDRAGVHVPDVAGEADGICAHAVPQRRVEVGCGSQLDDLLVAALHRAVALVEVDDLAGGVGQHLYLDVARVVDGLLQVDAGVAERGVRLAHRLLQRGRQAVGFVDPPHAPPTAARDGLDEHRVADLVGCRHQGGHVVGRFGAAQHRQPCLPRRGDGGGLVAGQVEDLGGRADEGDALLAAATSQAGVLAEEAVAGIDRVGVGLLRRGDDALHVQVGTDGVAAFTDLVALVRLQPVLGQPVLVREDGDRLDAELGAGSP